MMPSGTGGVVTDAVAVYFADATLASAFVTRWCAGQKVEVVDGLFRVRDDEPSPRIGAAHHKTPSRGTVSIPENPGGPRDP